MTIELILLFQILSGNRHALLLTPCICKCVYINIWKQCDTYVCVRTATCRLKTINDKSYNIIYTHTRCLPDFHTRNFFILSRVTASSHILLVYTSIRHALTPSSDRGVVAFSPKFLNTIIVYFVFLFESSSCAVEAYTVHTYVPHLT